MFDYLVEVLLQSLKSNFSVYLNEVFKLYKFDCVGGRAQGTFRYTLISFCNTKPGLPLFYRGSANRFIVVG